jgi:hypothetical protein
MVTFLPRLLSLAIGAALTFGLALVQPPVADAASLATKQKFIASLVAPAQATERKFGVPASVSIAEAIEASDWGTSAQVSKAKNYFDTRCSASMTAAQFAKLAESQVGKRYVLGAVALSTNPNPSTYDCSELVKWLFARSGNPITDLAAAQYDATRKVTGTPKVGDLVFLRNNPARKNGIGHVAVLTKKQSNGDWEIVEARGHAAGVVKTTLGYWKKRSYYAGLRRYSRFALVGKDGAAASAAKAYQTSCVTIGSTKYAKFASMADSFAANAAAITTDSTYKSARAVMASVPRFVDEIAKVVKPKSSTAYAQTLKDLIATYHLTDYDRVPVKVVLLSGNSGFRVTALQHLLKAAGYSTSVTGTYSAGTASAVKKFQKAKKLEVDGQAGEKTLVALFQTLSPGTTGTRTRALNTLLGGLGYATTPGDGFGAATLASVKAFQSSAGRSVSGTVAPMTWAALFMALDSSVPKVSGTAKIGKTLKVSPGAWGPGKVALSYQWYRGSTAISAATADNYVVRAEDAGSTLTVRVTGKRTGWTLTSRSSAPTGAVAKNTFSSAPAPKVTGTARVGKTLTAKPATWKPAPTGVSYQWYRDSKAVKGATKTTYKLTKSDKGKRMTVVATGTRAGYKPAAVRSANTAKVS